MSNRQREVTEMMFPQLRKEGQRGSKPRCHLLTHGTREAVAERLTSLAGPIASVSPDDRWMPEGLVRTQEATLPEATRLLPEDVRVELKRWWLSLPDPTTRTPNWDIASTCTIEDRPGILLVEAKAHDQELIRAEKGRTGLDTPVSGASRRNLLRIDWALKDASAALADCTSMTWALSRDWNYQMSNRFAWAWKLADLKFPVVLVYLGFLRAQEMEKEGNGKNRPRPFATEEDWKALVTSHSQGLFPREVWGQRLDCSGTPLIPLIQTREVPLVAPT